MGSRSSKVFLLILFFVHKEKNDCKNIRHFSQNAERAAASAAAQAFAY
jgi:hypothetical protein